MIRKTPESGVPTHHEPAPKRIACREQAQPITTIIATKYAELTATTVETKAAFVAGRKRRPTANTGNKTPGRIPNRSKRGVNSVIAPSQSRMIEEAVTPLQSRELSNDPKCIETYQAAAGSIKVSQGPDRHQATRDVVLGMGRRSVPEPAVRRAIRLGWDNRKNGFTHRAARVLRVKLAKFIGPGAPCGRRTTAVS